MPIVEMMANDLGYSAKYISSISKRTDDLYIVFEVAGRIISAPKPELKLIQVWIGDFVRSESEMLPNCVTAYEEGCSIVNNAKVHQGHAHLLTLDIRHFFRSCSEESVYEYFKCMAYADRQMIDGARRRISVQDNEARLLARLSCYRGGLAMGAPSSPFIANRLMVGCDQRISAQLTDGASYSRYADDICISSDSVIELEKTVTIVSSILAEAGYQLNEKKTHCMGRGDSRRVTGVFITPEGSLSIGPSRKRALKRELYQVLMGEHISPDDVRTLIGHLNFCRQVDPTYLNSVLAKYAGYGRARSCGVMPALRELLEEDLQG